MSGHFGEPQGSRIAAPQRGANPTAPILFPSGEDANPLNRRLPAEVVTRQRTVRKAPVQVKPDDEVQVDLKTALALRPDARPKWLSRAFKMAEEGKASKTELYDILPSRKFASGVQTKVGRKLHALAIENAELFSDKQQRYFRSDEWVLAKFAESDKADETVDKPEDKDDDADAAPPDAPREEKKRRAADRDRLAGAFEQPDVKDDKGSWTTRERDDIRAREKAEEARRRAKREIEHQNFLKQEAENAKERELKQQQAKKRQAEEEADSSLDLLERMMQQKQQRAASPEQKEKDIKKSRRNGSRDRDRDRDRDSRRKRGMSRSRSISVQAASPSRSRGRDRKRRRGDKGGGGDNFEDLLKQRMAQRNREIDSARIPVVDPGHAQRWKS